MPTYVAGCDLSSSTVPPGYQTGYVLGHDGTGWYFVAPGGGGGAWGSITGTLAGTFAVRMRAETGGTCNAFAGGWMEYDLT